MPKSESTSQKSAFFFQVVPAGDILRILLPYRKVHLNSMAFFFLLEKPVMWHPFAFAFMPCLWITK